MKKFFKWLGIIVLTLLIIATIAVFVLVNRMNGRMEKQWTVNVEKLDISSDTASIARGKYLSAMCTECHGANLGGKVFFDDPKIGRIYSANITKGKGGIGTKYTDEDWIRAIRHGINKEGKGLFVMPSKDFHNLNSKDLSNIIAFVKSVPPIDNEKGSNIIPVFTKILMQVGAFGDVYSAEIIDHDQKFETEIPRGVTKEYGKYLNSVSGCKTCHGPNLEGGKSPDPNSPFVPNLSPSGNLGKWAIKDFIRCMRTGMTPERGTKVLDPKFMPWPGIGLLNDDDLSALFLYLQSIPAAVKEK